MPEAEEAKRGVIRLRIKDVSQLFNSLDPDPFIERDLDDDAVAYITSWAREIPRHLQLKLLVEITEPKNPADALDIITSAVRNFFEQAGELALNEFRDLMRRGRISLLIGLAVLVAAVAGSTLLGRYTTGAVFSLIEQTLLIGGWVAMWRPMEVFLYDWWPLRRRRRDLERLRDMEVEIKLPTAAV
jgi:hypothetical protein